jgi:hypothetical protein
VRVDKLDSFLQSLEEEDKEVLRRITKSPVEWELLHFYFDNPFSIHTVTGLASIIGRQLEKVKGGVEQLTKLKILRRIGGKDFPHIYAYEPERKKADLISQLMTLYKNSGFRPKQFRDSLQSKLKKNY